VLEEIVEDMLEFSFYHYVCACVRVFHILTNTKFKHVPSTYYPSWYSMVEFKFNVTYFHRVYAVVFNVWNTCFPMSCGHRVVGIMNGHSIHAGPLKGPEFLSIYLSIYGTLNISFSVAYQGKGMDDKLQCMSYSSSPTSLH
jgi:hypothetical protein